MDGRSLLPLLTGEHEVAWRDAYRGTYDMMYLHEARRRMIRSDQWRLVVYLDNNGPLSPAAGGWSAGSSR